MELPPQETTEDLVYIAGALADLDGNILKYLTPEDMSQTKPIYHEIEVAGFGKMDRFVGVEFEGTVYPTLIEYQAYQ